MTRWTKEVSQFREITVRVSYFKIDESRRIQFYGGYKSFRPYIIGDLYFDARLPGGYKGFGSFELKHDASVDEERNRRKTDNIHQ